MVFAIDMRLGVQGLEIVMMRAIVVEQFLAHGWLNEQKSNAIAHRYFNSVVGEKNALIWMSGDSINYRLTGEYQSEGRNVLSGLDALIPATASLQQVKDLVVAFIVQCEEAISKSYGVRLLSLPSPQ